MEQGEERREWPRVEAAFEIRLKDVASGVQGFQEGRFCSRNVSTGGMLFESEKDLALAEGAVLDVEIFMPLAKNAFSRSRKLEARGKVCRAARCPKTGRDCAALEFLAAPRFVTVDRAPHSEVDVT